MLITQPRRNWLGQHHYAPRNASVVTKLFGIAALAVFVPSFLPGQNTHVPRFESDIAPIFEAHCLTCHGERLQQAELDLRTRDGVLKGGQSGPAVVPREAVESLLLEKVSSGAMPMGNQKLSPDEIEVIRRWIETGALRDGEDLQSASGVAKPHEVSAREIVVTILNVKCLLCHGRRRQEGGLDMQTRAGLLRGGASGPAIVPGKPDESLLIKRIEAEDMPPEKDQARVSVRPVTSAELEKLRAWIAAGAPFDDEKPERIVARTDPLVAEKDRAFWSFRPPKRSPVPKVHRQDRARTPIDAFLLRKLTGKGLAFSPDAEHLTLMRRAYFDVIGLPPSPEEVKAYRADTTPKAYERLVDRLLVSPRYGEHWGRRWLDAAGYSDSEGQVSADAPRPYAWRYRDYVIRSFNADKPYDRFLVEQIAGDELFDYKAAKQFTPEQREKLVATGFLRMGPDGTYSTSQAFVPERLKVVADQLQILTSTVLGLTVACARCHDHKYDPIPQRDYYRLSAILRSAYDPYDWLSPNEMPVGPRAQWDETNTRIVAGGWPEEEIRDIEGYNAPIREKIKRWEEELEEKARPLREQVLAGKWAKVPEAIRDDVRAALDTPQAQRSEPQKYLARKFAAKIRIELGELESRFESFKEESLEIKQVIGEAKKELKPKLLVRALLDMGGRPTAVHILHRGEFRNPGGKVEPGVPSVLSLGIDPYRVKKPAWTTGTSGRRLALARWLTQPHHPLTARVMVNRVWQHYFSVGLVKTEGNFGRTGSPPSHPELLDWLATEFVRRGWSLKALHRLILTSTAYRQSSLFDPETHGADPDNVLLSRFPLRRLDADAIRDSILQVAGRLDSTPFGPPDEVEVKPDGEVVAEAGGSYRRSIYLLQRRKTPVTILAAFDAPQLSPNCLRRTHSTVSSQALQMMNSDMVRENSRYMAGRVIDAVGEDAGKQVERVYLAALSRPPSQEESNRAQSTLLHLTAGWRTHLDKAVPAEPKQMQAQWLALATLCHTVLNSAEFLYID